MNIRPSALAGTWYPGDAKTLRTDIKSYLQQAHVEVPKGMIYGVVVPHAGYRYSAPVAAYAFNCLEGLTFDTVVIISPYHDYQAASLLTTAHEAYETPLGIVPVDKGALGRLEPALQARLGYGLTRVRHDREHAVEIELPFLQHVLGNFSLLPVMMCEQDVTTARALGEALAETLRGKHVLFVASSDLSHFYPQVRANKLDAEVLRRLERFDPEAVINAEAEGVGLACGRGAIAATLYATKCLGANAVKVLHHATSGEVTGDEQSVVGYGAAIIV